MEKFIPVIVAVVLMLFGALELYLTYRYSKNVKKMKYQPPTAPLAIWSGLVFGLFFIAGFHGIAGLLTGGDIGTVGVKAHNCPVMITRRNIGRG